MDKKGHFKTERAAQNHAAMLRREWPKMKPVRVVKAKIGWNVYAAH